MVARGGGGSGYWISSARLAGDGLKRRCGGFGHRTACSAARDAVWAEFRVRRQGCETGRHLGRACVVANDVVLRVWTNWTRARKRGFRAQTPSSLAPWEDPDALSMASAFWSPRFCFSIRIPTDSATASHAPIRAIQKMVSISLLHRSLSCAGRDPSQSHAKIGIWPAVGNLTA